MRVPSFYRSTENYTGPASAPSGGTPGVDAFMTANQKAMPQALHGLAQGVNRLGGAIVAGIAKEREEQNRLDLIKDLQEYEYDTSSKDDELRKNNQGELARDLESQSSAYHLERLNTIREKWGNNNAALTYIEQRGGGYFSNAMNRMRDYASKENERYGSSVMAGEEARAIQIITDPNSSGQQIKEAFNIYGNSVRAYYAGKGLSPEAAQVKIEQVRDKAIEAREDNEFALLLRDDPQAAMEFARNKLAVTSDGGIKLSAPPKGVDLTGKTLPQQVDTLVDHPYVRAVLNVIAKAEGTAGKGQDGYNIRFGGETFEDLSKHPNIQKKFTQTDGTVNSSGAAGRYQFINGTWDGASRELGLSDFSPRSQDKAAVLLLIKNGTIPDILKGNFGPALKKLGPTWASLPSSPYKQARRSNKELNKWLAEELGSEAVEVIGETETSPTAPVKWIARENAAQQAIKRQENEHKQVASVILHEADNYLSYGLSTGDFTKAIEAESKLLALGRGEEATALREEREISQEIQPLISGDSKEPIIEQFSQASDFLKNRYAPENAKRIEKAQNLLASIAKSRVDAFKKDPFTAVQGNPVLQEEGLTREELTSRAISLQEEMGKGIQFTPTVMPDAIAKQIKDQFENETDYSKRVAMLSQVTSDYGAYAGKAANQAGLPLTAVAISPIINNLPRSVATRLFAGESMKPTDLKAYATDDEIKEFREKAENSDLVRTITDISRTMYTSELQGEMAASFKKALIGFQAQGGRLEDIEGSFYISNGDGLKIVAPKEFAPDGLEIALQEKRKELMKTTTEDSFFVGGVSGLDAVDESSKRLVSLSFRSMYHNGVWVYDGENGYALINAATGNVAITPDGNPVLFNPKNVTQAHKFGHFNKMNEIISHKDR